MNVKVFQTNANGKIEFTRCELEKLLNEIYNDGYHSGEKHARETYWTWSPSLTTATNLPITYNTTTSNLDNFTCTEAQKEKKPEVKVSTSINNNTPKTYTFDISKEAPQLSALTNMVESILNSSFTPKAYEASAAIKPKNDVFSNLEKELRGL